MTDEIIRVFPKRTKLTPIDEYAFIGDPPALALPEGKAVHVSCTFTQDKPEAERLKRAWSKYYPDVRIGGPAYGDRNSDFIAGVYIQSGVTFTSRGCPNRCGWCLVKTPFREFDHFEAGWVIQDDNILAGSRKHFRHVCSMLGVVRKAAKFAGGLEAARLTQWHVEQLKGLRIQELFFACDSRAALKSLERAYEMVKDLRKRQLRCYVLIGYDGEDIHSAEDRLREVWDMGFVPFAQLYQPADRWLEYDLKWTRLANKWSRPAAMFAKKKRA